MSALAPIHRIVLTGGPCGGKSTALERLSERLKGLGFDIYRVPEAATIVLAGGAQIHAVPPAQVANFQAQLLGIILALEDGFHAIAQAIGRPSILLCDRGTMDGAAYLPPDAWAAILDDHNFTPVRLRDRRYDAVIHLVTAADGAEAFYTTENNAVRSESPEKARLLDERVRNAWVGHPILRVIDNSTDFAGKIDRVVAAVCTAVGAPLPGAVKRVFRIASSPATFPVHSELFDIEETPLLTSDGTTAHIRRRGQNGAWLYTHSVLRDGVLSERQIPGRDYAALLAQANPATPPLKKMRRVFVWANRYFELDTHIAPNPGLQLLHVESDSANTPVDLPPFLAIEDETKICQR